MLHRTGYFAPQMHRTFILSTGLAETQYYVKVSWPGSSLLAALCQPSDREGGRGSHGQEQGQSIPLSVFMKKKKKIFSFWINLHLKSNPLNDYYSKLNA